MRIALCVALLAACQSGVGVDVKTEAGVVHGADIDGVMHWLGIPFAAPPVGELRWRAPQPVKPWRARSQALPVGTVPAVAELLAARATSRTACISTCGRRSGAHELPVMVWIHGGAFIFGSGGERSTRATRSPKQGVVVVTINYRLGAFGFLAHPALDAEDPAYRRRATTASRTSAPRSSGCSSNIAAFGGDPKQRDVVRRVRGRVLDVRAVLLVGRTKRSVRSAAIVESGAVRRAGSSRDAHADRSSIRASRSRAARLRGQRRDALACMRAVDYETARRDRAAAARGAAAGRAVLPDSVLANALPNVDGFVIAHPLATRSRPRGYALRPLILGTNQDEGTLFHAPFFAMAVADETEYRAALAVRFGAANVDAIVAHYPVASFPSANAALAAVTGDAFFVCPARRIARAVATAGAPRFATSFERALEQPVLRRPRRVPLAPRSRSCSATTTTRSARSAAAPRSSTTMQADWTRLREDGAPGSDWPAYDAPTTRSMRARRCTPSTRPATKSALCDFWDGLAVSAFGDLRLFGVRDQRRGVLLDHVLVDEDLVHRLAGRVVHDVEQRALEDRAQTARAALLRGRHVRDLRQRALAELELHAVHLEQLLVLLRRARSSAA